MTLRLSIAFVAVAVAVCGQNKPYVASAGTPPRVVVRPGTIPSGPYVLQPSGALGGAFAGNAISRPLGGGIVVNGPGGGPVGRPIGQGPHRVGTNRPVVFASYVPQVVEVPVEVPVQASWPGLGQPVIINQYFGSSSPESRAPLVQTQAAPPSRTVVPGDPLSPPENYYLIAYRDRNIYTAMAWWVEGDTLHYVTTQNVHNQTSLNFIDLEKTRVLNSDRNIPFAIPGR